MQRRTAVELACLAVVIAANTFLEVSSAVATWADRSTTSSGGLPPLVRDALEGRPETSDADVHLVMWFVAAALLVLLIRPWRQRALALVLLLAYTGLLELAQAWFTKVRGAQWSDLGANAVGIAGAALAIAVADRIRPTGGVSSRHRSEIS